MEPSSSLAAQRDFLIERLVGESAEPDRVGAAARALGERALPPIARALSELIPSPLQFELERVELGRMSEAFQSGGEFEPLTVASSAHSPDALLLSMNGQALSLLTGLLFGAGPEMEAAPVERPMSGVERSVAGLVFKHVAEALNGSGTRAMNVRFPLPAPIFGEDRRKQVHRDGPSVRLDYRIFNVGGSGRFSVTMPQRIALAPRGGDDAGARPAGEWQSRFGGEVMRSQVQIEATISMGRLTLGDIAGLRVGQVLDMPAGARGDTRLAARGKTLFVCEFGKLGQNYTVRVKHPFDPEQDLMNDLMPA